MTQDKTPFQVRDPIRCTGVRYGMLAFGWINVALGVAGMFLPVMPTTVFLLIALWAFSRSSERFHRWLYSHPRLGRTIRAWHAHRVIPLRAKVLAVGMMTLSVAYVAVFVADDWLLPVGLAAPLAALCAYIVSRPSEVAATLMPGEQGTAGVSAAGEIRSI